MHPREEVEEEEQWPTILMYLGCNESLKCLANPVKIRFSGAQGLEQVAQTTGLVVGGCKRIRQQRVCGLSTGMNEKFHRLYLLSSALLEMVYNL